MQVGILTAPFRNEPLEKIIEFAGENGFEALEVASAVGGGQIDVAAVNQAKADEINAKLSKHDVQITSLAMYMNVTAPDKKDEVINSLKLGVDAAQKLGVGVVCTLAGMPVQGKDKMKTIEEDCPLTLKPIVEYAAGKGIKIALENWYATNIQNLAHWRRIFEVIPDENFGLNFDPSHLLWQGIDYIAAVHEFAPRIFHTHAKDTEINDHVLSVVGNQAGGWWRYVIPGFGRVKWGEYIAALRRVGYNGVLSIEHEDAALGREEGFIKGKNFLKIFA